MSLKNVFTKMGLVEEDAPTTKKTAPAPQLARTAPSSSNDASFGISSRATNVDPEITEMLEKSLQDSKLSNFDYLKFISMVDKMRGKVSSEEARFQTAFSAAEELGLTKNSLIKSTDHYLEVLEEDENDFGQNCTDYEKKEVKSRETKLSTLEATINLLTKQLEQAQQDRDTLSQELENQKAKLETRKTTFQATLESFRQTIKENVQKINQYLQ